VPAERRIRGGLIERPRPTRVLRPMAFLGYTLGLDQHAMPRNTKQPRTGLVWVGILILYVVWGSTYLGIRIAVESIPPFLMAGSRFALAGLAMLGFAVLRAHGSIALPTRREWRDSLIVGGLLMGGGMGMVALGEESVASGIAALLIAMMPLWVAVLGRLFLGERLPKPAVAGIALGLVGVGILVGPSGAAAESFSPGGILALIVSPICWASGSLFSANRARLPRNPLVATGAQMLAGSLVLAAMAGIRGEYASVQVDAITANSLLAFGYLVLVGSLIAFTTYVWLLRVAPLPLIATYAYVNPIVAVILGALVLHEEITQRTLVAGGVIVFAVALIITSRNRMSRQSRPTEPEQASEERPRRPTGEPDAEAAA
jgi:drug/metabolite transporter (DMT)-like permease